MCLLVSLCIARTVRWMIENPDRSAVQFFPYLMHLMSFIELQPQRVFWSGSQFLLMQLMCPKCNTAKIWMHLLSHAMYVVRLHEVDGCIRRLVQQAPVGPWQLVAWIIKNRGDLFSIADYFSCNCIPLGAYKLGANWVPGCHSYTARWMQLCDTSSNSELNPRTDKWRSKPSRRAPKRNKCALAPIRFGIPWYWLVDVLWPICIFNPFDPAHPGQDWWTRSQKQRSISCRVWPGGGKVSCWKYGRWVNNWVEAGWGIVWSLMVLMDWNSGMMVVTPKSSTILYLMSLYFLCGRS